MKLRIAVLVSLCIALAVTVAAMVAILAWPHTFQGHTKSVLAAVVAALALMAIALTSVYICRKRREQKRIVNPS